MSAEFEPDFITAIRFHAARHNISVYKLLKNVGVADSQWRRWKARDTEPRRSTLNRILTWPSKPKAA